MARALSHSLPSTTLSAAIRAHFGLTQAELGQYLEVSSGHVAHLEAGRKLPTALLNLRLTRLARRLPPPEGSGPAAPVLSYALPAPQPLAGLALPGPLQPAYLQKRQRQCARRLALLRRDLHQLGQRHAAHERRRWALPRLAEALAPQPATDPAGAAPAEQAHAQRWLAGLAAALPPAPARRPDTATALALLLVQAAALEAEAATLARLVEGSN